MEYLTSFFEWLGNLFTTIFDFFSGLIDNFVLLFKYLAFAVEVAYSLIDTLPVWLKSFATLTIVVSLIYIIVGRSTGGKKSE